MTVIERVTPDTNLLFYATNKADGDRHKKAVVVLKHLIHFDCLLTLQCLSEFFYAITRKKLVSIDAAINHIHDWQELFPVVHAKPSTINRAFNAVKQHKLPFWDAMLWATAKEAGVTLILSEDFQNGRVLEGVKFLNPFVADDFLMLGT